MHTIDHIPASFAATVRLSVTAKTVVCMIEVLAEIMTTKDALHHLIDVLPDEQADLARELLEDLQGASDIDGPALDAETLASLDRGLSDISAGRVKSLDQYKRERGL